MTRKINFALCLLIVLVFIAQTVMMCQPYFEYTPKLSKYEVEKLGMVAEPRSYSLLEFVWTDYSNMSQFMIDALEAEGMIEGGTKVQKEDQLGELSNSFVLGLVGITVLGAVVAIMTIFTRKSIIQYCFSLAWAACGIYACFAENFVLQQLGSTNAMTVVMPTMKILAIAAAVLVLARAYPCIYSRYIYKDPIDYEALNA